VVFTDDLRVWLGKKKIDLSRAPPFQLGTLEKNLSNPLREIGRGAAGAKRTVHKRKIVRHLWRVAHGPDRQT